MLLLGPETRFLTKDTRRSTFVRDMLGKPKTLFDGDYWVQNVSSKIVSFELNLFKTTFSDGTILFIGDKTIFQLRHGRAGYLHSLNSRSQFELGLFHREKYDIKQGICNTSENRIELVEVKFSHRGVAWGIDGVESKQKLCLTNGLIIRV